MNKYKLVYCETDNPDEKQKVAYLEADNIFDLSSRIVKSYPEANFFTVFDEDNNRILTEEGEVKK